MKNLFLLNRLGLSPDLTTRQSRVDSVSIASRYRVLATLLLCLTLFVGVGNAWGADVTDEITASDLAATSTTYTDFSNVSITSDAKYAGNSALNNSVNIQLRSKNSNSGIVSTTSGGTVKSVTITVASGSNTIDVYGSNTAYSAASDLYGTSKGTKIGSLTATGTINFSDDYAYVGIRSSSGAVYLSAVEITWTTGGGSTPSVTPTPTSLDWGTVLQGSSQSTKTISISGSNLTAGSLTISATGGYSVTPTSKSVGGTLAATTLTVTPPSTATAGTKNGKVTISGGGLASNVEVNLTMTVQASHTVTWMVNGSEHATTQVADGSKPTFPSTPSSCDGTSTTFVGWTPTPWSGKLDDVSAKTIYTSGSAMPNVSGPVTYHAVFAKETSTLTPVPNTWTRITSTSQLTDGATVMLVQYYSDYAINNTPGATSCTANAEITNSNAALRWIAVKSGSKWKFKTSGGAYLSTNALDNNTNLGLNQTYDEWTISTDNGGTTGSNNTYTNTNCFRLNNGSDLEYYSGVFKLYTWSLKYSSAYPFYIYIQKTTGSTTYSQYLTTCCTSWSDPTFSYNTYSLTAGGAHATKTITGTTHGTLSFESSNTGVITVDAETGEVTPVGAGTAYVIAHWTEADGYCAKDLNSSTFTVSGNVTVTFKKNGGTGTDDQTQSVPYNTATALKTLAQVGYTAPSCKEFYGWADSQAKADAGTRDYTDGQSVTLTTGKTLYAVWKTITYTVTKGTCTTGTFSLSPASSIDCNGTITVTGTPDASHKGDPIVSISPADAGTVSGTSITNVSKNITVNVEFAAKEVYTVTWSSPAGTSTSNITEGNTIGAELPSDPSSCSVTYNTFVGWFPREAGSESDPTAPATWTGYSDNDKVTASTVPTGSVTYYAVFSDGGGDEVTDVANIVSGARYYIYGRTGQLSFTDATGNQSGTAAATGVLLTFTEESGSWYITTPNGYYIYPHSSSNGVVGVTTTKSDGELTITNQSSKLRISKGTRSIQQNNSLSNFGGYGNSQTDVKLIGVASGYISTCGISVKVTNGTQHITSANGVWTASNAITVEGQRLTSSGSANKRIVVSSDNDKFKIRAASTQDAGNASAVLPYSSPQTYITTDSWSGTFEVTYTPTSANTTESATITVKVCNQNSSTALAQKTFTVYGRSLPANFLIAVNDGTLAEGHWYAIPADMVPPYGSSCSSGLGTYKPIPITVDNNTNPTKATIAPARAVYQPVERSTPRTSPQTLRFKSKTLSGGTTYYLYGGGTGGEGATNNTHIQNASFNDSEKQKWFLETEDLQKYNVHLAAGISPNVLGYTTAGGNNKVGQYSSGSATTKKDIWFLPYDASECTYFHAPTVTPVSLDGTNYTIQFTVDRGATAWQISTNGGSTWTDLGGVTLTGSCDPKTTAQVALPLATYRGQTVDLKVKSASVCEEKKTTFTVPNPVITVTTPWHLYGVADAAFDNSEKSITLSGLYTGDGASTTVTSSNPNIHAELVAPIENGTVAVRLTMTAGNATEGDHTATLTFNSTGAETKTVALTITMQSLAGQSFTTNPTYFSGNILCGDATPSLSLSTTYPLTLTNKVYKSAGVYAEAIDFNSSNTYVYDVATGTRISEKSVTRSISSGVVSFSLNNQVGDMIPGREYRIEWINTEANILNSTGVPYQNTSCTFTYAADCSKPIATVACPITQTGFTANWIPQGSSSQSLYVYTKETSASDVVVDFNFTTTNPPAAVNARRDLNPKDGNKLYLWGDLNGARRSDYNNYWRIANGSKHDEVFSAPITTAGTYNISVDVIAHGSRSITIALYTNDGTSSYRDISTTSLSTNVYTTIEATAVISAADLTACSNKIKVGVILGSNTSTDIGHFSVIKEGAKNYVAGYNPKSSISSSTNSYNVTGLTAGTTYYYTVSNGSESNEMSVTTRSDDPAIDFSPAKAVLQTESGGTTSTTIGLDGTNLTLCELAASITGTNAALFGYDLSSATYNSITGELGGTLTITYHPTAEGTHTATLTIDGVALELEGHSCPAGFETMATAATSITENSATANWSQSTTGYLMLAENQKMNTELLINGGFEQDGLGWDGIPSAMMPSRGSRQTAICTSGAKTGSKCAIMTGYGSGSYLYPYGVYSGTSTLGAAIYGEKQTLPAGTYTISAYLHNASTASELQNTNYGGDCNVYLGVAVDCPSSMYATARRSLNDPTGQNINGKGASWFQVSETFTLEEPTSCYIYLAYKTSGPSYFAVDDISLKCTGVVPGNNFEEKPITSATNLALTDLKPSTSYSYYIVSETGCESNIISFTTLPSDDPVTVSATPDPVNLTAPLGGGSGQLVTITQENAYSDIFLAVGDCGGRITLSQSSVSSSGGAVSVNFSPLPGDAMGDHGSCTVTMSTLGMASSSTFTVNWTVSSGKDINTPTIEVVDISNEGMTIEHNIEKVSETSSVIIDLSRERDPETIEENAGDEIFFSKYYEAYQHKKILAIYNPTNHDISLANTYIWRSKGSSAGDKTGWNQASGISLASYGKTTGVIAPKEEIILYNNQLTYTCEQGKTDMSGWSGTAEQAIYFDGDDAFLLARKNVEGTSDDPPTESVTGDPLTWREYQDEDENSWWMLDLIGARTKSNDPDGSNLNRRWSWRNCTTSANEDGDEAGWIGYGYDVNDDPWSTNTCNSQPAGYLLSTNRCLLIRRFTVKSGNNAVAVNVGDMYTLGKGGQQSEWKGAHVPTEGDQAQVSCENFSFVGGYDYAGYYNAWTDMTTPGDYLVGSRNPDGSYTISDMIMPKYWCNSLRIKVVEHETVNGVEVDNVRHYQDYKVPIVVDENSNTANEKFFGNPNNPTADGADDNFKKANWATECATCDVVVRDNVTLTRDATSGSKTAFRNIQVYPGAKLMVTAGQAFDLNGVEMRADNNEVSYAIINDDGSTITVDSVTHVKRIDDSYWYAFSLPYDCDVVSIRQLNGKSMGTYDDGVVYGTWTIKEYDGEERQSMDDFAGAGSSSRHWKVVPANGTLQKHKGYIIGLYETEWAGQHKSVFFPPKTSQFYTENGGDSKTATVHSWAANNAGAKKMNKGWNFVGLPYISLYNPQNVNGHGINNTSVMITGSFEDDYADQDHVYVSLPTDAAMKYYTQSLAGNTKLKPFSAYFVQVDGETDQNRTITYYKSDRTLSAAPRRARAEASSNQRIGFELLIGPEETQDRTGILLSDDYTLDYEIGRDMYKMTTSGDKKPHIWSVNPSSVKMAYTAMPMANGTNIPLGIYLPAAGAYTLTKDQYSDVSNVEAIYLLRDGEIVADLLFNNYDIVTSGAVTLSNYAIRVVAAKQVPTDIDVLPVDGSDWNSSTPKKFIYKDQLYILRGGNIYDATGKQVREIK